MDLHRHDEFSAFDGFGKPLDLAKLALSKGHTALGTSNHGTANGLVETYMACKEVGIKPILGVEVYYQPKFSKETTTRYHLCLFAKDLQGYKNLNKIMTEANIEKKYYKPIVDNELLKKYHKGLICTTACVAGYISQSIIKGNEKNARRCIETYQKLFGEDLYLEIQPYPISDAGVQEMVNEKLMDYADEYGIKCILTSDSHFGSKEDIDTYMKMHEIAGHTGYDLMATYGERYMPTDKELMVRFYNMHGSKSKAKEMIKNLKEIEDKVEADILGQLELELPKLGENSGKILQKHIIEGLKKKGKYNKKYMQRCKEEFEVIKAHGFEDYFLIVEDYVKFAKEKGIAVGPGRGSVCNCQIAYALDITNVDSLYFNLDFRRFLRLDKKKLPDVDIDFETDRRQEVIEYLVEKYKGHASQICSYGLYKIDNLLNDLFKVCGVEEASEKAAIKKFVGSNVIEDIFDYERVSMKAEAKMYNKQYQNIIKHFSKMYKKVRYIGTHAAGVAITGGDILMHTSLETRSNKISTAYDLNNLEAVKAIKFDMLGLRTLSIIKELEELTGEVFSYDWLEDATLYEEFKAGNTDGIFQFEKGAAKGILQEINTDCAEDVIAASALNRPGPLSLKMPAQYASNKADLELVKESPWYEYTKETYGTIVYQEQIQAICRGIGKLDWADSDKVMKMLKGGHITEAALKLRDKEEAELRAKFLKGAMENGFTEEDANDVFNNVLVYSFNKGHATGYALISIAQMYYKIYHPASFWYITLKYAANEASLNSLKVQAVKNGNLILLPHVNYRAQYSVQKVEGEKVICEGLSNIKNVGEKAALVIEEERLKNGRFKDIHDFKARVPKRSVNARVIDSLVEAGALCFDKATYFARVKKYNSTLFMKGL